MRSNTPARAPIRRWMGLVAMASFVAVSGRAAAQSEQQELVNASETTFATFMSDPDMTWLQRHIGHAKGVLIAPKNPTAHNPQADRLVAALGRASSNQRTSSLR